MRQGSGRLDTQDDVMIWVLWDIQTDAIINIKLGDAYMKTYRFEQISALLAQWEKIDKYTHGKHCHNQRKHFSPFVISIYGMLGREVLVILANLSRLMEAKTDEPISHVQGGLRIPC